MNETQEKTKGKGGGTHLLIGVITSAILIALSWTHFYEDQEASIYDFRFRLRNDLFGQPAQNPAISTIDIDDVALQAFGFPFPRDRHALLIDILGRFGARMIGFDIFFYEPGAALLSPEDVLQFGAETLSKDEVVGLIKNFDQNFTQASDDNPIVYLAQTFEVTDRGPEFARQNLRSRSDEKVAAIRALERFSVPVPAGILDGLFHTTDIEIPLVDFVGAAQGVGFALPKPDHDGIVRRYRLLLSYDGRLYFALAFLMACDYLQVPIQNVQVVPGKHVFLPDAHLADGSVTDIRIPITGKGEMLVNWAGTYHGTFRHLPYNLILDFAENERSNGALKIAKKIAHNHPDALNDGELFLEKASQEGGADLEPGLLFDKATRVFFGREFEQGLVSNPDLTLDDIASAFGVPEEDKLQFEEVWTGPFREVALNLGILNVLKDNADLSLQEVGERMGISRLEEIKYGVGVLRSLIRGGGVKPEDHPLIFEDLITSAGLHGQETADRIVTSKDFERTVFFYGLTATGTHDLNPTPFGAREAMLGAHVNVFNTILTQNFLGRVPRWGNAVIMLALGLLIGFMVPKLRALPGASLVVLLLAIYMVATFMLFAKAGIWVDALGPVATLVIGYLSITLYNYVQKEKEKEFVQGAFGHYLDPKVIDQLVENPEQLNQLGGDLRVMTAFFSDVASFSTISENLTPVELVVLLNEYLSEMCDIIAEHSGTIDKFEGDAIIAFWGAPLKVDDHARRALMAAVDMQHKVAKLRKKWETEGKMEQLQKKWAEQGRGEFFRVRMGINTGEMVVGNMGSRTRVDYTMMGDSVNLAARLEGAGKAYDVSTMISESTFQAARNDVEVRELDSIRVVGKDKSVRVYELLGHKGEVDPQKMEVVECYADGVAMYKERKWDEAIAYFEAGLKIDQADGPCRIFIERCQDYKQDPPAETWDAVYALDSK